MDIRGLTRSLRWLAPVPFLLGFAVADAEACECVGGRSACQALATADAVFVGRVVSFGDVTGGERAFVSRVARLTVTEAFTGTTEREVSIFTGIGGGDCGFAFRVGTEYLVYAHRDGNGRLTTSICARTQPASWLKGDIEDWRKLPASASLTGRLSGRIRLVAAERTAPARRLTSVTLTSLASGEPRRVALDEDGRFAIDLPQGPYRLTLPDGVSWTISSGRQEVFVPGGTSCAAFDLFIEPIRPPRARTPAG
jgi:hypothetical protein